MLLTSVVFAFEHDKIYSEQQVNALIQIWISQFGTSLTIDHVTLRRYLVDEGILIRDQFGTRYQLADMSPFFSYDPSIRDLDLEELIAQALEDRGARKRAYLTNKGKRSE